MFKKFSVSWTSLKHIRGNNETVTGKDSNWNSSKVVELAENLLCIYNIIIYGEQRLYRRHTIGNTVFLIKAHIVFETCDQVSLFNWRMKTYDI